MNESVYFTFMVCSLKNRAQAFIHGLKTV